MVSSGFVRSEWKNFWLCLYIIYLLQAFWLNTLFFNWFFFIKKNVEKQSNCRFFKLQT